MQIDQRFLRGGEEITPGKTLQFELASVEVVNIKEDPPSPTDVRIINGALVATQRLPNKYLSLDFQIDVPSRLRRKVTISDKFNSLASYQSIMSSAIIEELNFIFRCDGAQADAEGVGLHHARQS